MSTYKPLLPDYLLKAPSWSNPEPPPPRSITELPFDKLSPEDFERFCLNFFIKRAAIQYGDFYRLQGEPGQPQQGYDIWGVWHAGEGSRGGRVFAECKRRIEERVNLREIVHKFLKNRDRDLQVTDQFWIFTSANLRSRSQAIQKLIDEFKGVIQLVICDAHGLTGFIRKDPGVYANLVAETFGGPWANKLFNGDWLNIMTTYSHQHDIFSKVLKEPGIIQTLRNLYPNYPLMELYGKPMPLTIFEATQAERENIESALGRLVSARIPAGDEYGQDFDPNGLEEFNKLRKRQETEFNRRKENPKYEPKVWNGATYAMERLELENNQWGFQTRVGRYFQAAATCDLLEKELIDAHANDPDSPVSLEKLPRRKWLHERLGNIDPVTQGDFRSAAIAISTLVIFYDADYKGYKFLINERSTTVLPHPLRYHVIPSMMFQPVVREDKPELEYSVRHNIYREFLEELYDMHEVRSYEGFFDPKFFYNERPLQRLMKMLEEPNEQIKAHLLYTGIAVNLMNLRPEICTVLIIKDPKWIQEEPRGGSPDGRILRFSEEYLREEESSIPGDLRLDRQEIKMMMELDNNLMPTRAHLLGPENLVPPAAAAILLGLKAARQVLLEPPEI